MQKPLWHLVVIFITSLFYWHKIKVRLHVGGIIDCFARYDIMDRNSDVSDVFAIQIFDVVKAIRSKRKRPGCISIHNYINAMMLQTWMKKLFM